MKKLLTFLLLVACGSLLVARVVYAEQCDPNCGGIDECTAKINECQKLLQISVDATKPSESKMNELQADINAIEANLKSLGDQINLRAQQIDQDEKALVTKQDLLATQVRNFYKKDSQSALEYLFVQLLSTNNVSTVMQEMGYRQTLVDQQKRIIVSIVLEINGLSDAKKKLEGTQVWMAAKKQSIEVTLAPIRALVASAKAYQTQLSQTVGTLSARQQELIAERLGSLGLSRSAGIAMACSDDRNIDPGFSPRLAFYTFGIPHRVGMNQFGAFGRAQAGQSYDQILRAYYNFDSYKDWDTNTKINVDGNGSYSLEDYTKRIYEVPNSWGDSGGMEALKAQAIAARSYALAYTNNGSGSICTTQSCQVFQSNDKGGNWDAAVDATKGKVMIQGGNPIKAWFSSTDGGYTLSSGEYGWSDTPWTKHTRDTNGDVNSISDLQNKAYDRSSPCFYNAQGWRTEYNKSAWLKPEEVADIVNVTMLASFDNAADTYDADKVKSELRSHGQTPFNQITDVSMSIDFGSGTTTSVTLTGDAGSKTFDGTTFKNYFNVRAPANIAIVGPLYNIEKR